MGMKKLNKNIFLLIFAFCFGLLVMVEEVNAVNISKGGYINFSTYGLTSIGTTHSRTSHKQSNGEDAYCIQIKKNYTSGNYTTENCTANALNSGLVSPHYVVAGQIVDIIDKKDWAADKKYAYKVAALNVYFKSLNVPLSSGSANFTGGDISSIISDAKNKAVYYGTNKSKNIAKPNINVASSKTMKIVSGSTNTFVSNKITFDNLNDKFNGNVPTYTFTTSGTGTAYLCTSMTSGCKLASNVKVSGVKSASYYLKVEGAKAGESYSISIVGDSASKYKEGVMYCKGTSNQAVMMTTTKTQNYKNQNKVTLQIPDTTKHKISILKVDESGETISGSDFELYEKGTNQKLTLSKNDSLFTYETSSVDTAEDDFFNKTYCYKEVKVPFGYRVGTDACFEVSNNNSTTCYANDTSTAVEDTDYCNKKIVGMCKITKTKIDLTIVGGDNSDDGGNGEENPPVEGANVEYTEGEPVVTVEYHEMSEAGCVAPENTETPTDNGLERVSYVAETKCVLKNSDNTYTEKDEKYCSSKDHYSLIEVSSGNVFITVPNQKNNVIISKKSITGDKEIAGARLKICTEDEYKEKSSECKAAKTIDDVELNWVSSDNPANFTGIKPGTYYIVEVIPPAGYKLSATTATKFLLEESGIVKTGDKEVLDNNIVINNELNELVISKTDVATGKELPGAKLSICATVTTNIDTEDDKDDVVSSGDYSKDNYKLDLDQDNNCLPVSLADGTEATWVSTNEPHVINGLPAGTYYLVETSAPNGYSTTESILFTMKSDGTLLDENGNLISDKKIVMKDAPINQVSSGMLSFYLVLGVAVTAVIGGLYTYYHLAKDVRNGTCSKSKYRKRKIHK